MTEAPSFTAWATRCACTWPSSVGGVIQTTSIGMPFFADSSFAAASAPVRAERKTGFVELFAIMAIFSPLAEDGAGAVAAGAFAGEAAPPPGSHAAARSGARSTRLER